MRIAIYGVGAVGGYFGARLARSGEDVAFVARGRTLRALGDRGLRITSADGNFEVGGLRAFEDPAEIGPVDAVLLGVKAWQIPQAAEGMRPLIGPDTCVLPLQNGVEAPRQLTAVLGPQPVLGGTCKIISSVVKPGHIVHHGVPPHVALGELDNSRSERVQRLRDALERSGVQAEIPASIQAAMWNKFVFISTVSGIGAVTRSSVGELRDLPETRTMLELSMREIVDVGLAHEIPLPPDAVAEWMAFLDTLPAEATASMQRDITEGRPSELEAQNGAVVRLGFEKDVDTPVNAFVYYCLLPMERRARTQAPSKT